MPMKLINLISFTIVTGRQRCITMLMMLLWNHGLLSNMVKINRKVYLKKCRLYFGTIDNPIILLCRTMTRFEILL